LRGEILKLLELNDSQINETIKNGEFDLSIITSKKNVAVVMTQSWCPQWSMVKSWLTSLKDNENIDIYLIIYDEKSYFEEFLVFKETILGNFDIPYIRYYTDGKLIKETNFTSKDFFLKTFNL